jgi:hypothetical protein
LVNVASTANLMIKYRHITVNCVAVECGARNQSGFRCYIGWYPYLTPHLCQKTRKNINPIDTIVHSRIDKKVKRSATTVVEDTTFRNQPPTSRQNSDPGMWRSAANFTPHCNFPIYTCYHRMWATISLL